MARRNFYEIINESSLNLRAEYDRIYDLLYDDDNYFKCAIMDIIDENFNALPNQIRGRTLSLYDFNQTYSFDFQACPLSICADDIIAICEYAWNLCSGVKKYASLDLEDYDRYCIDRFLTIIDSTIKALCHKPIRKDEATIFVPENQEVVAVAEIVDIKIAVSIMEYHHYTLKGNVDRKQAILKVMADNIEGERAKLRNINKNLETQLFQLLNKFVRHDHSQTPYISTMKKEEIEKCYDDIYQMWLLAKLEIDHYTERKDRVAILLDKING